MDEVDIEFVNTTGAGPNISELYNKTFDGSSGIVEFDGYYYVSNPDVAESDYRKYGRTIPTKEVAMIRRFKHGVKVESNLHIIEIYRRDIIECTDRISTIEYDDGSEMKVCFFPSNHQRIYFHILETNPTDESCARLKAEWKLNAC